MVKVWSAANICISSRTKQCEEWSPPHTPYNARLHRLPLIIFLEADCSLPIFCSKYLDNTQSPVKTYDCILHCRISDVQPYLENDPTNREHQSFIDRASNLSFITILIVLMHMGQWPATAAVFCAFCGCPWKLYVHAWSALGWVFHWKLRQVLYLLTRCTTMVVKKGNPKGVKPRGIKPDSSYDKGIFPWSRTKLSQYMGRSTHKHGTPFQLEFTTWSKFFDLTQTAADARLLLMTLLPDWWSIAD